MSRRRGEPPGAAGAAATTGRSDFVANIGNKPGVVLYVHPDFIPDDLTATCYPILSGLLPARMSAGILLTAEVPAWLSSVMRILVRYTNKDGFR